MVFRFKLRKGKKGATIIAELRSGTNLRIRQATQFVIPQNSIKYWDTTNQMVKIPNDIPESTEINVRLSKIRTDIYASVPKRLADKNTGKAKLKEIVNNIICPCIINESKRDNETKYYGVLDYFKHYVDFYSTNGSPFTGSPLSPGTLRTYKNAMSFLKKYLNKKKTKDFRFEDIDKDFYYDYIQYGQELGYSKNYIGSIIQKLKTIVQAAYDEGIHKNVEFRKRYFKKFSEEINHPYLTKTELMGLSGLKIEDTELDTIRDVFLIACFTGLRISDLMRFLKDPRVEMFNGKKHIHIVQGKTGKPVFIPLNNVILDILDKRNGNFPPYVHMNTINREIKRLLKKCGVIAPYMIEKTVGGKSSSVTLPKYKLISCHSARRSFCTNAYNSGVPLQDIMVFSGHGSEKMLLLYIKASAKEKARRASDHPFFR
ncbi:tyrosine-type recombinase/integrase [Winogradskyella forsetii]|uniref:tyrosine-type recombinase/integrase n=1 Tax=Winogradskyella forsetii TaxID=2686077 RepID=UPI0015C070F3|nr:site-specific integrase [Winogradskyella forsetii]